MIAEKWSAGLCPSFDGVTYADGTIVLMEHRTLWGGEEGDELDGAEVRPLARSTIDSFLEYNPERWAHIGHPDPVVDEARGLALSFGEGSMGGDGFVALGDTRTGELRWIAFFQASNPFERAWLEGSEAVAVSTNGLVWRFPLERPEMAHIASPNRRAPG
jgi:hypothetical protein